MESPRNRARPCALYSAIAALLLAGPALAQPTLAPGEMVMGSRTYGSIYGPVLRPADHTTLMSGPDLAIHELPVRGGGPSLAGAALSMLALSGDRLIAAPATLPGHFAINPATGDRQLLPGTNGPLWTGAGEMLALDSDTFLAVADDFAAANLGDGKLLKYRLSTGETTLISGVARGDGIVMYRPRAIARLDAESVAVMEFGPAAAGLPGSILFRVDLATGNRTVISTIAPGVPSRYTSTGGVRSANRGDVPLRGSGPTFGLGNRGVAVVGGRLFVAGTADGSFLGGFCEVNPSTGDRTLVGGVALAGSSKVTVAFGAGSDPYTPDAPTSLQTFADSSFVFVETFGPNRVWKFDIDTRRIKIVADLDPQILPEFRSLAQFTALTVVPCAGQNAGFELTEQPFDAAACPHGSAAFHVGASTAEPFGYRWRKNSVPIDPLLNPSAATATLTISDVQPGDPGSYDCIVTGMCGSLTSDAAALTVCPADFDCTGFVDTDDFTAFILAFDAGTDDADFDASGFVDTDDFTAFVLAFQDGC